MSDTPIKVGIRLNRYHKAILYRAIDGAILPVDETLNKVEGYYVHSTRQSMEDYWHDLYLMKDGDSEKDIYTKGIHLYEDAQRDTNLYEGDLSHILPEDHPLWDNPPQYFKEHYFNPKTNRWIS